MNETKQISVPLADQQSTIAKLHKDGWTVVSYGFAPEGPTHCLLSFEREKGKPVAPAKTKAKPKKK